MELGKNFVKPQVAAHAAKEQIYHKLEFAIRFQLIYICSDSSEGKRYFFMEFGPEPVSSRQEYGLLITKACGSLFVFTVITYLRLTHASCSNRNRDIRYEQA